MNSQKNYGTTDGVLKPMDEAFWPDPRFKFFGIENDNFMRPFELADLHERLTLSKLDSAVPEKVRRQFETAKNLILYSWFVFEFHIVGELHAYASLEFALRTRFPDAKRKRKRKGQEVMESLTLGPLLQIAVKEGVIVAETLPAWERVKSNSKWYQKQFNLQGGIEQTSAEWLQKVIEYIPNFRNTLAHGNPRLYFESSLRQLETCVDLTNQVFSSQATQ